MQKLSLENYLETNEWCGLVQELCEGGELEKSLGKSHYSERTVRISSVPPSHPNHTINMRELPLCRGNL